MVESPDFNQSHDPMMLSMLQSGIPKYYEKDYTRVGEIKRRIDFIKYRNQFATLSKNSASKKGSLVDQSLKS